MSSSRRDDRSSSNQDFIAKIRYGNSLPPPSNPPKLLNIPNDALSQYCKVDFTNRLARENFSNVEADVESGMHLDVWGLPGVFDGDDSAMLAQENPTLHPADKDLLIPLGQIGRKSQTATTGPVSFLRRTEYISGRSKTTHKHGSGIRHHEPKPTDTAFDEFEPVNMLAAIMKSFDVANPTTATSENSSMGSNDPRLQEAERNWNNPKHPLKKNLKLVDSFPLFPDFEANPNDYVSIRFNASPIPPSSTRDERLDIGMFKVNEGNGEGATFDYYLPDKSVSVPKLKSVFSIPPPPNVSSLPGGSEDRPITYNRIREYESISTINFQAPPADKNPEYVLVLNDGKTSTAEKSATYYPLLSKMTLRPKRNDSVMNAMFRGRSEVGQRGYGHADEEAKVDAIKFTVRDMTEEEKDRREKNPLEVGMEDADGEVDADGEADD